MIGCSLTEEDEDAVLNELAEIEQMEAEALGQALPEAPLDVLVTGKHLHLHIPRDIYCTVSPQLF
jgi:hypothetical protein